MLKVKNETESASIYISGDIVDDAEADMLKSWGAGKGYQWPDDVKQQLDAIGDKDLTVYINSDGGSVPAGVAIANMIARHKGHTMAVVDGWACSIATQIFFAADERKIPANAYLMIHKPSTVAVGNADDLMEAVEALNTIQQGLETTYNKATREGVTPERVHEMVENTTWLTGEQAAELFDVDVLDATKTAARAGKSAKDLANIPKAINIKEDNEPTQAAIDKSIKAKRLALAIAITEGELDNEKV